MPRDAFKERPMKITDLVDHVADAADLTKTDARKAIDAVVGALTEAAQKGDEASLPEFGKFKVKDLPAREGRNPATGATITIAASRKIAFTPAKALKDALSG
ncbi:HU family DNA-binding protein [Gluconacetobacter azotocaptans]|uniref:HU family DNA-binding protein n=1 Tax=Gluconacetobacter azotocaptans TaxID=142834 RepID=UPI00195973B8|nr:HU family DNA-binding protein [Gluconacetobacter azotocaptans]MBM9400813.1 HU family DNA-binding protein [Gluconacetobacter azotocaptans]